MASDIQEICAIRMKYNVLIDSFIDFTNLENYNHLWWRKNDNSNELQLIVSGNLRKYENKTTEFP